MRDAERETTARAASLAMTAFSVPPATCGAEQPPVTPCGDLPHGAGPVLPLSADLLGRVSHELRSPLTAIKGYAATLLRHEQRLPREERREFLEAISQASERLQRAIDRLIEMSQLTAGTVRLESFPVDLGQLVEGAVREAEERAEREAPGRFAFTVDQRRVPPAVDRDVFLARGDARQLRHVVDHLLENAVKYSPDGGAIEVTVRRCPNTSAPLSLQMPAGGVIEIEVRDGGLGIPEDHLERVFDRFHQVDARLSREADGMGLGLAIAKRIVELHGGCVWAERGSVGGTVVHVCLPSTPEEEADTDTPGAEMDATIAL